MRSIGIMQGRLTETKGRGIQFFPFDNWKDEFFQSKELGLNEIEFIFDFDNYTNNPLWSKEGVKEINRCIEETGIKVNSVCFDYFIKSPFFAGKGDQELKKMRQSTVEVLKKVITNSTAIGAKILEIPLVDNSSLKTVEQREMFKCFLEDVLLETKEKIMIGLETDMHPCVFKKYLDTFSDERVGANYDSGNSSGLGYNQYEEVITLDNYILNVHIKDRKLHGLTVNLGEGDADFEGLFQGLKEIKYSGSFILQAARGIDGNEKQTIKSFKDFVKNYIKRYGI